jgi:hypothetical protein
MKSIDEIKAIKANAESKLLAIPGVHGVGIGHKEVAGKETDETSIIVYVDEKKENVPDDEKIPSEINGIATDVKKGGGTAVPHSMDLNIYNPLRGGIAIGRIVGNGQIEVGTIGAIVKGKHDNKTKLLSSFHVLAVSTTWKEGDPISQPAGNPTNIVARLDKARLTGNVDAAVAIVDNSSNTLPIIEGIQGSVRGVIDVGELWMQKKTHVRKRGITTGPTEGEIKDISATVPFNYGHGITPGWQLSDQILIQPLSFSAGGDSGSAIVDDSGNIVGLLAGGNTFGIYANRIQNVLEACDISISTS